MKKNIDNNQKSQNGFKTFLKKLGGSFQGLSKLSRAFLLPIALLPIAGVFLGVGATIVAQTTQYSFGWYFGNVLKTMGDVSFANLPVLFCISVAIAYTEEAGVAALTAIVGFLVFNGIQSALLTKTGDTYKLLWWKDVPAGLINSNIGVQSLNTGVFAAIFVGGISAFMYRKFYKIQLPKMISFFSGSKFVPIVTFVAVIPLSFLFMFIWPPIGKGLEWFGMKSGELPNGVDSLIFEVIERSLIPFGLHHVFYAPLWWTSAGGSMESVLTKLAEKNGYESIEAFAIARGWDVTSNEWTKFREAVGDNTMMFQVIAAGGKVTFKEISDIGLNLGRFQSGKFGFMLFALPAAAVAMWLNCPKQNRKNVMGIYFSAAFTCFLTGITEPIEFTFLFLAPWLFYAVHMPLCAIAFMLTGLFKVHVAMTVSGGMIDFIVFGLIPLKIAQTNALWVFVVELIMAPLYFTAFYFAVKYVKVNVPGRSGEENVALYTKQDVKQKEAIQKEGESQVQQITSQDETKREKARKIIEFLGGKENIVSVGACASRLRVTVKNPELVQKDQIMGLGGAAGILVKNNAVQVVYGGEQEVLKPYMQEELKKD